MKTTVWVVLVLVGGAWAAVAQEPVGLPASATWNLDVLKTEPYRVVKAEYDPDKMRAKWLIELTRDFTLEERLSWAEWLRTKETPVEFVFKDRDGVALKTVRGGREGEEVHKTGARFRVVLDLPKDVWEKVKTADAVRR